MLASMILGDFLVMPPASALLGNLLVTPSALAMLDSMQYYGFGFRPSLVDKMLHRDRGHQ
jgi:hypothetical protein